MSRRISVSVRFLLAVVAGPWLLSGCVNQDISDLQVYADQILARKGTKVEKLPEIKPYERYIYHSAKQGLRDPFQTIFKAAEQKSTDVVINDAQQQKYYDEITNRNKEELETFEIDSLRMVGTLEQGDDTWGILLDPEGIVYRVRSGNYLGRNAGKIVNIFEDRIEIREIISTGDGIYEERQATMALYEQE